MPCPRVQSVRVRKAAAMTHTLKIRDIDPMVPGLALPDTFESLEKRLDSTIKLCRVSNPPDGQILSMITVCQDLHRLLKCSFIENGILASRLEIFTRYHTESIKNMNKTITSFQLEHKVTKKQIKRLRKRMCVNDTYQRKKNEKWWNVQVRSTDYESFSILSKSTGSPDLEFMLRINQILIDFVRDEEQTELQLPPMGQEERAELSKLASIYKIRCRYGKSTQLASSTLMKARQTCIPGHGEIDAILDGFARNQNLKRLTIGGSEESSVLEEPKHEVVVTATEEIPSGKRKSQSPPISTIPSTMLTPLSSLSSPTIDISGIMSASMTPSQSPPTSGLSTPTTATQLMKIRRDSSDREKAKIRSRCGSQSGENPLPASGSRHGKSSKSKSPPLVPSGPGGNGSGGASVNLVPPTVGSLTSLHLQSHVSQQQSKHAGSNPKPSLRPPGHPTVPAGSGGSDCTSGGGGGGATGSGSVGGGATSTNSGGGNGAMFMQQHHTRPPSSSSLSSGQQTVVASPLKVPISQLSHVIKHNLSGPGRGGGAVGGHERRGGAIEGGGTGEGEGSGESGRRDSLVGGAPLKRIRLTRKSAGGGGAPEE